MNVVVTVDSLPPPPGVALYAHTGGRLAGGGGSAGGADGGWQTPSQSTMYSTYTKLPSYALSFTADVATVVKVYAPSVVCGSSSSIAHWKKPRPSTTAPSDRLHLPCTSVSPLTYVAMTCSSSPS